MVLKFKTTFCILFLLSITIFGQQYIGDNKLVVEGNSKLIIESDRASFEFSVLGFGSTLREALDNARLRISNATKVLTEYRIPKENITTSSFESGENFDGKAFLSSSRDFKTLMRVFVIVDSLSNLENIIVDLSEQGIESIYNITYSLHDFEKHKSKAKEKAIEDAQFNSKLIADKFGVIIKKVIYIEETGFNQTYPNPFNPTSRMLKEMRSAVKSIYSKPVKITQRFKVVYEIE